jgi:hypothetical protein
MNHMTFGPDAQKEHLETGKGFGLIGMGGSNHLKRSANKDQKILKKKPQVPLFGGNAPASATGGSTTANGFVSSVVLTPRQGMELINPDLL